MMTFQHPSFTCLPDYMQTNPMWNQILDVTFQTYICEMGMMNELGVNFPAISDEMMIKLLEIQPHERVLDIGGGDDSFARANVITDAFPDMNAHRSGRSMQTAKGSGKEFVQCFAEDLPFDDKSFDVAYSRAVFEHTIDPAAACREMMRVAHRGYIETPTPLSEYLGGHPTHRWIVWVEMFPGQEPTLVFRRKPFCCAPFSYLLRGNWFTDRDFQFRWEWRYRNLIATQFAWEGSFHFRIEDSSTVPSINYDDPQQSAIAHLDAAISSMQYGDVPEIINLPDIESALTQQPDWAVAHNTKGCILWGTKRRHEAHEFFGNAHKLEPDNRIYLHNFMLQPSPTNTSKCTLQPLPETLVDVHFSELQRCAVSLSQIEMGLDLLLAGRHKTSGSPKMQEIRRRLAVLNEAVEYDRKPEGYNITCVS